MRTPNIRACGPNTKGGVYAEASLGSREVEDFLLDPPQLLDFERMGITPLGVRILRYKGAYHIFDFIQEADYPNVADFVEEARNLGVSRRLSPRLNFSELTRDSRLMLIHRRAYIANFYDYFGFATRCPKGICSHEKYPLQVSCAGLWWNDLTNTIPGRNGKDIRHMPGFSYEGRARPTGFLPIYKPAVFLSIPIGRLLAVKCGNPDLDERHMISIGAAALPCELVDL